jgi:2'-5' RNA ligase
MKFRAFIAVDIEPLPKLLELADRLRATGADIKLVEPKNIHITMKFLGDTDEGLVDKIIEHMAESSKDIEPLDITLENIGAFPNMNYMKVIWVGLSGAEPLVQLARSLDGAMRTLGFKSDKKGFKPHLTIGRVKSPRNKTNLQNAIEAQRSDLFGTIHVDRFVLKKSVLSPEGPTYTDIHEVILKNADTSA